MSNSFKYLSAFLLVLVVGCDGGPGPDQKVEANRMEVAQNLHKIFTETGGNYEGMTLAQKTTILGYYHGDEAKAKQAWGFLKQGGLAGNGGGAGSSSMASGPGMQPNNAAPGTK